MGLLKELPAPPPGKSGWPWTEEVDPVIYSSEVEWPKVSMVTPSFNQGQFIEETIRSILLQNYPDLEYFIFDAGSTDETVEIIQKYANWLSHWKSESDRGQSHAINKGLNMATGKYQGYLNSDDALTPKSLWHTAITLTANLGVSVVYGHAYITDSNSKVTGFIAAIGFSIHKTVNRIFCVIQPGSLWLASAYGSSPKFNESNKTSMDGEFYVELLLRNHLFKKIDQPLVFFRMHPESITYSIKTKQQSASAWDEIISNLSKTHKTNRLQIFFMRAYYFILRRIINTKFLFLRKI